MNLLDLLSTVVNQTLNTLVHNWPFLLVGLLSAAALKTYVGTERIATLFRRRTGLAVGGAVATAVATPFCSCGTTAVVLSMMAASVPRAPVVAFMVASPLTSPDELFLSAGLFGWPFALTFFVGSIVLGLAAGVVAFLAERARLLEGQARFAVPTALAAPVLATAALAAPVVARAETSARPAGGSCCATTRSASPLGIGPGAANVAEFEATDRWRLRAFAGETWQMARTMVPLFLSFAMIGYAIVALVPTAWITTLLGGSNPLSIVLAATLGIPFYISTEASLPLVASLMHGGLGAGPAMAFLVTGAGTSAAAIAGGLLIARWRVLAIVVGVLWIGAIGLGLATVALGL